MTRTLMQSRLARLQLRKPFVDELVKLVRPEVEQLQQYPPIAAMFATLSAVLPGPEPIGSSFQAAWTLMYATISRLDALQDGDPIASSPKLASAGEHYNLVFASYILAAGMLDELEPHVPDGRLRRVQRFWNNSMLRMADGQQDDLASGAVSRSFDTLAVYQQIAQAKTGATYALAFGGMAILLAENEALIEALTRVGEIYGMLVQYADDLRDAAEQPNAALTLPALLHFIPHSSELAPAELAAAFWSHLCASHLRAALDAVASFPVVQQAIATLFSEAFARRSPG